MYPVLFTAGPVAVSSFGLFMAVAFLSAVLTVWRIARSYDFDEEKILDLVILTFFGALIGARIYFVLLNLPVFDEWSKMFLINRYPGLSFWGGLISGFATLWFFSSRMKLNFWQIADYAAVAALIGVIFGDFGCFLGGCEYGALSQAPFATQVIGLVGKRFPVALLESIIFIVVFWYLWKQVVRFHFSGKIASLFLILVGVIKFFLEFYRGDSRQLIWWISLGHIYSLVALGAGLVIFYTQSKRNWKDDLMTVITLPVNKSNRRAFLIALSKAWYNQKVGWVLKVNKGLKVIQKTPLKLKRRLNVRSTPSNFE